MNITVYCGANEGNNPIYKQSAIKLSTWIAKNQHTLIYGGGKVGLMGIIADHTLQQGSQVIGVIPIFLKDREMAHPHLTEMYIVHSMDERKRKMLSLGDVCIALPGGPGTLEEITEVISWARVGENNKPCIFYNVNHYYDLIANFYDKMVEDGFLSIEDRSKIFFSNSLDDIELFIKNYIPPKIRTY